MTTECKTIREPAADRPVAGDVDVLVTGSGPAGFAAALASAREGARTLLVERYGYLGGMMTGSLVTWVLGVGDGQGHIKAKGIVADLRNRLERFGGIAHKGGENGDYQIDAEVFKWQGVEMLTEEGTDIRLHTLACDPILDGGRVAGAFVESKSGRQAIRARVVVDASADADIAFRAGCACENATHDVSLIMRVEGVDGDKLSAFKAAEPARHDALVQEARARNGGALPGATRHLKGIDVSDAQALTQAEILLRRDAFNALAFLQANLPGYENARLAATLPQLGVRQGRRIRGECVVTDEDLRASRHVDDGIARLGSYLEGYKLYGAAGLDYDIPYRCLVPETVDGLLVAGRCVSCDYLAANTLRLIVPCFATGQAAGIAAALAVRDGVEPRRVSVSRLRAALAAQNVYL